MDRKLYLSKFWSYCKKTNSCWIWTRGYFTDGYGQFKHKKAHRVAWKLANPDIPIDDILVLHECDNRKCIRPSHLFLGTYWVNMLDMVLKDRQSYGPKHSSIMKIVASRGVKHSEIMKRVSVKGERHPSSKLTSIEVRRIRDISKYQDRPSFRSLANRFNVTHRTISLIVRGETWKEIA